MAMSGSATELVTFNASTKTFEVNPAAVRTLQKIHGPVAVVSVCGRARQGKSTLLNQLLGKLSNSKGAKGFTVASTHRPCTKGLWIWSQPIQRKTADGKTYHLILVDCEGIDAFDQTMDYSTQIFSLGVLLSSLLVFNQMGGIDESSIDKLSSVCEFAKLIRSKSAEGGGSGARDAADLSPSFLWLLRDFHFQLKEDGREITACDYMEEVLGDMSGSSDSVKNRNQMRVAIKQLFPDRDCVSLVRPLTEEAQLANMDTMPFDSLRPEFRKGLDRLTDSIVARAQPKAFRGQPVTGSALAAFAQAYVTVINTGKVPKISSTWQGVIQSENQRALDASLTAYEKSLNNCEGVAAETEALDKAHIKALTAAMAVFQEQALGDFLERQAFEARLRESTGGRFGSLKQAKLAEADSKLSDLLSKATTKFLPLFSAEPVDVPRLDKELSAFLAAYDKEARGPTKYKRIAEFMVNTLIKSSLEAAKRSQAAVVAASAKTDAVQKELAEAKSRASDLATQLKTSSSGEASLRQQLSSQQQEVARLNGQLSDISRKATEAGLQRDALSREVAELKGRASQLTQRTSNLENAESSLRKDLHHNQGEIARLSAESSERGQQLSSVRAEATELRSQLNAVLGDKRTKEGQLDAELNRLRSESQFVSQGKMMVEAELARARADNLAALRSKEEELAKLRSEFAAACQAAARGEESSKQVAQLSQHVEEQQRLVAERDVAIQRLHTEREFLQQQYDSLRRTSLSPLAAMAAGGTKRSAPEPEEAPEVEMTDAAVARSRKRVKATPTATPPTAAAAVEDEFVSPFSHEREILLKGRSTPGSAAAADAGAGPSGTPVKPTLPDNVAKMTIQEMKGFLTDSGFELEVFTYNMRKPAPKKEDWVKLIKEKCV